MNSELYHIGMPHDKAPGRGSGRYPWGSGKKNKIARIKYVDAKFTDVKSSRTKKDDNTEKLIGQAGAAVKSFVPSAQSINKGAHDLKRSNRQYDLSKMSDEDLRRAINRMNLEENYKYLRNSDISKGESKVNSWLGIIGGSVGIAASAATIAYIIWKIKTNN